MAASREQIEAYDHFLKKIKQFQTDVRFMNGLSEESMLLCDLIHLFELKHIVSQTNGEAFLRAISSNIKYIHDGIDQINRKITNDHIINDRSDCH